MKKHIVTLLLPLLLLAMAGCSKEPESNTLPEETTAASNEALEETSSVPTVESSQPEKDDVTALVIQISDGENVITFQLNDSKASKELYEQLPLSLPVEDYSNNEKIFYPPNTLDVSDAPKAGGEVGTLAYYEPWGDVVMFFGSYSPNGSLYELGQVTSGSGQIQNLAGNIEIGKVISIK